MTFVKTALAAVAATAFSAGSAFAVGTGIDFKVNEGVVPGIVAPSPITADSMTFDYSAVINQSFGGSNPFTETGNLVVKAFSNGIATVPSSLGAPAALGGYGIVGDFSATGTTTVESGSLHAIFSTFTLNLYLDSDQNGIGETLLGSAALNAFSEGHIFAGLANGDFDIQMLFTPTAFGNSYFVDPSPFLLNFEVTGVNTSVSGASTTGPFTANITGSGNAFVNNVPEPGSLALIGLGLLSAGVARRRAKAEAKDQLLAA